VSDAAVFVYEDAGAGVFDAVYSTVDFTLTGMMGEIEVLGLQGSALRGIGNNIANTLTGNDEANTLLGMGGNDTVFGFLGNDTLDGGDGNDSVLGGDGDDVIIDRSGADRLFGDFGNDSISGGTSNDRLYGGNDEDTLLGGAGADLLYGGLDADTFQFARAGESTTALLDQIVDFENGTDLIDLSRIDAVRFVAGNQAFTYIGGFSFSNVAGELRFFTSGANGRLAGDTNGDGIADFELQLNGSTSLFADSLIL
jgi:Ca2+-binding RTX toxin-like protein